ncbi:hypothetical protein HDU67_007624 [Dinochytrium kinnereticum]|nr:hypothetical protein HDU67_007624 [Dinochytrium kinnereticum]
MLFNTILAFVATIASVSALPAAQESVSAAAAVPATFALTGLAKGAAQVYLLPGARPTSAHIFAVGTTFAATDYVTYGTALAQSGVVSIILDFSPGSTFKSYNDYPLAIDSTLKALALAAPTWATKYNVTYAPTAESTYLGGHSAGGWASVGYALNNSTIYGGMISWDPVNGNPAVAAYNLPYPHLILHPKNSGCTGQISATNNGEYFFNQATGTAGTHLYQYTNAAIRHNSVTSSGFIGNLVCSGKVAGFQADLAAKVAAFTSNPSTFAATHTGSTTGTFAYTMKSK